MHDLLFRQATEQDLKIVAEIMHGSPGREAVASLHGEKPARRFGFALVRVQARVNGWDRTIIAGLGGAPVGVLQWRPACEPAISISLDLAWAILRALGPLGAFRAWRWDRASRRVTLPPPSDAFHIEEVHVLKRFRGGGIGSRLLAQAEVLAHDKGYRQLSLHTHTENPAQRLYHRIGFREIERCEDPFYKSIAGVSGRILMVKHLAESAD